MYKQTSLLLFFFFPGLTGQKSEGFRSLVGDGSESPAVSRHFPLTLLWGNIAPNSLLCSSEESRDRSCQGISFGTQPGRGSFPLPAVTNMSLLQKELLKALEVRARTLEASAERCNRKAYVERKMCKWGCADRTRKWCGVREDDTQLFCIIHGLCPALRGESSHSFLFASPWNSKMWSHFKVKVPWINKVHLYQGKRTETRHTPAYLHRITDSAF